MESLPDRLSRLSLSHLETPLMEDGGVESLEELLDLAGDLDEISKDLGIDKKTLQLIIDGRQPGPSISHQNQADQYQHQTDQYQHQTDQYAHRVDQYAHQTDQYQQHHDQYQYQHGPPQPQYQQNPYYQQQYHPQQYQYQDDGFHPTADQHYFADPYDTQSYDSKGDSGDELPDDPPNPTSPFTDGYQPYSGQFPPQSPHTPHGGLPPARRLPSDSGRPVCASCGLKEVFVENSGKLSQTCSRTCQRAFKSHSGSPSGSCRVCHLKDAWKNPDGVESKTCSKVCQAQLDNHIIGQLPSGHSLTKCLVEKCDEYVFRELGNEHLFCTKKCRNNMNDLAAKQGGAVLIKMKPDHAKYPTVKAQITKAWKKTAVALFDNVDSIYIVYNPTRWQKYKDYRKTLDEKYKADSAKPAWKDRVNQQRRFHGTYCDCELKTNEPCAKKDGGCGICGIVTKGFDMSRYKSKSDYGRFGKGIYLTDVSAKAHDYTGDSMKHTKGAGTRWMLLCLVALGQIEKMHGDTNLVAAPNNADSVEGLTKKDDPAAVLNLSECVVYNVDAVYPCYIINYKFKGGQ